jgi:hypothetical protein
MSLSMYQASVPAFLQTLNNLSAILDKAEAYAGNRKIDPEVLLNYRLAPDMFPFVRQIQIAADLAKGAAARLAGVEVPKRDDTEKTFADLSLVHYALQKKRPQDGAPRPLQGSAPVFPWMDELDGSQGYRSNPCRLVKLWSSPRAHR